MGTSERVSAAGLLALAVALAPARAQETPHPIHAEAQHVCVNQKDRRVCTPCEAIFQAAWCARGFATVAKVSPMC
jgi:hypothetical protein